MGAGGSSAISGEVEEAGLDLEHRVWDGVGGLGGVWAVGADWAWGGICGMSAQGRYPSDGEEEGEPRWALAIGWGYEELIFYEVMPHQ